jgi:hypothetical protein
MQCSVRIVEFPLQIFGLLLRLLDLVLKLLNVPSLRIALTVEVS